MAGFLPKYTPTPMVDSVSNDLDYVWLDSNIGDQLLFTLKRVAASADEYGGDALLATVGIHYQVDTIGSKQMVTKR